MTLMISETLTFVANMLRGYMPISGHDAAITNSIEMSSTNKPIQIRDRTLFISEKLQQEIVSQIPIIEQKQQENAKTFSIPIERKIGLGYIHQGRDYWKIKLTYGSYPVETTDKTIYTTKEILKLKQAFELTKKIAIGEKKYYTNTLMQQIGSMLHKSNPEY